MENKIRPMARKITLACTLVYFASYVMRLNFAVMIAKIYTESANQRIAYNELRKAFGDKGRQYLKMMKEIDGTDG